MAKGGLDLLALLDRPLSELATDPRLAEHLLPLERVDDRTHVSAPELGLDFSDDADGLVRTVHIHVEPHDGMNGFRGRLPAGLSCDLNRSEVRALLGVPESFGEAVTLAVLGPQPSWDRFLVDGGFVHVSYRQDGRGLSMVTVMSLETAPATRAQ